MRWPEVQDSLVNTTDRPPGAGYWFGSVALAVLLTLLLDATVSPVLPLTVALLE
jgi:hypothetical protein